MTAFNSNGIKTREVITAVHLIGHFTLLFCRRGLRILNARAELLFCSLNLLFGDVFVGVDRRRDSSSWKEWRQDNEKISPGQGQVHGLDFVRQETISNVARLERNLDSTKLHQITHGQTLSNNVATVGLSWLVKKQTSMNQKHRRITYSRS